MIDYKKKYNKYKFKYLNAKKLMYGRGASASADKDSDDDDYNEPTEPTIESDELMIKLKYEDNSVEEITVNRLSDVHETISNYLQENFGISDNEQISINFAGQLIEEGNFYDNGIEDEAYISVHTYEEDPNKINLDIYLIVGLEDRMPKRYHITLKNVPINTPIKSKDFLNIPNWPKRENIQANSSSNTSIFNATWSAAKKLATHIMSIESPNVTTANVTTANVTINEDKLYITNKYHYDMGGGAHYIPLETFEHYLRLKNSGVIFDIKSPDVYFYVGQLDIDYMGKNDELDLMLEDPEEITLYYP